MALLSDKILFFLCELPKAYNVPVAYTPDKIIDNLKLQSRVRYLAQLRSCRTPIALFLTKGFMHNYSYFYNVDLLSMILRNPGQLNFQAKKTQEELWPVQAEMINTLKVSIIWYDM